MKKEIQNYFNKLLLSEDKSTIELYDSLKSDGNYFYFSYDLNSDKLSYICPTVYTILGYRDYDLINKDLMYLGKIIHPEDFLVFVSNVISYLNIYNCANKKHYSQMNFKMRLKHKDEFWVNSFAAISILNNLNNGIQEFIVGKVKKIYVECTTYLNTSENKITRREKEVLQLVSNGDTSSIIARKLYIDVTTVFSHRKNLIKKLMVSNTSEMIKKAVKLGIID